MLKSKDEPLLYKAVSKSIKTETTFIKLEERNAPFLLASPLIHLSSIASVFILVHVHISGIRNTTSILYSKG